MNAEGRTMVANTAIPPWQRLILAFVAVDRKGGPALGQA